MNVRWLMPWLLVMAVGCAHASKKAKGEQPEYEHVFQKPLAEALAATRELLESRGYTFEETQDSSQLLTTWEEPDLKGSLDNTFTRYLVTGIAVGPRQSVAPTRTAAAAAPSSTSSTGCGPCGPRACA